MNATDSQTAYAPTDGLSYDPAEAIYWQPEALAKEITRTFEVCAGCRMCFKYCDAFPTLFQLLDEKYDGAVEALTAEDTDRIFQACFQCKLCEVQCPYTPRDNHPFQLDFPKLVHRYRAQKRRREGASLRDRLLGDPDRLGRLARWTLGLMNKLNRSRLNRLFMEKTVGIHRHKVLPDFAQTTFESWAKRRGKLVEKPQEGLEVVLFQTCFVQHNEPQLGRDALEVLERNGVKVAAVSNLGCCGMPAWEHGDYDTLEKKLKHNLQRLAPFAEAGVKIMALNPTCTMMLRREYPELAPPELRETATKVAEAVRDPGEFLWELRSEGRFNKNFKSSPGKVAYHVPCHLRVQAVGFKGRDLIRTIPGVKITTSMNCSGHDGTYAMKVESYEASIRIGEKAFHDMQKAEAEVWATDCPLAAVQLQQHAGKPAQHPLSILAAAYRENGFPNSIEPQEGNNK